MGGVENPFLLVLGVGNRGLVGWVVALFRVVEKIKAFLRLWVT